MESLPGEVRRGYRNLANDPKYQHFARIPDRIIQCIDYFGITCDKASARRRLSAYYLFIGVVDDAIDSGRIDAGRAILDYLRTRTPVFGEAASSSVSLITEVLKYNISADAKPLMMDKLDQLYREVVDERCATSIDSYIEHRTAVGSLTAELSYILIQTDLGGEQRALLQLMKQVGAIGCLVDSLIDLSADRRLGLLGFRPRPTDYSKLVKRILTDGVRVSLKHPGLCRLFLWAVADNLRDRIRADRYVTPSAFVPDRKDAATGVA